MPANYSALLSFHVLLGCVDAENSAASERFLLPMLENARLCLLLSSECSSSGRTQQFRGKMTRSSALWWKLLPQSALPDNHIPTDQRGTSASLELLSSFDSFPLRLGMAIASVYQQAWETSKFPALRRSVQSRRPPNPDLHFSRVSLLKVRAHTK